MSVRQFIKDRVPKEYIFKLLHLKKQITGFHQRTYSESGEDILLKNYLFKGIKNGFYVDIGCFHPKFLSNTYVLHTLGWSGINVDPNPESIAHFNRARPRDTNLLFGIANKAGERLFNVFENAGASSFANDVVEQRRAFMEVTKQLPTPCITLRELFENYLPHNQEIDLLDVDVEDLDMEVIESNDWDKYRPKVILIEDRAFRRELDQSKICSFLKRQGYVFHSYCHITLIMCDASYAQKVKYF